MARSRFVEPSLLGCFSGRGRGPGPKNGLGFVEPSLLGCFSGRGQGSRGAKNGDSSGASSALQGKKGQSSGASSALQSVGAARDTRTNHRAVLAAKAGSSDSGLSSRETLDSRLRGNDERGLLGEQRSKLRSTRQKTNGQSSGASSALQSGGQRLGFTARPALPRGHPRPPAASAVCSWRRDAPCDRRW